MGTTELLQNLADMDITFKGYGIGLRARVRGNLVSVKKFHHRWIKFFKSLSDVDT